MKIVMTDNRVLMAILVIASIGGTYAVVQGFDLTTLASQSSLNPGGAFLTGNVKVIQYDADGNIIAYRQTDNHIVKEGMEIIMAQVFRGINTTTNYPASATLGLPHLVEYMQIGTGGEHRLLHNNTDIAEAIATCTARQSAGITNTTAQGAHGYPGTCDDVGILCSAQMNVTAVANFQGSAGCNVNSIDEAGIFDNSTGTTVGYTQGVPDGGGYMFARNTFGSVNLGMLDTLQLQWEFTFTDS
jgi:hypothetical protein